MKLAFVGDVMLGRLVNDLLKNETPDYPWGNTLGCLALADARFCNLECVISNRGRPWSLTRKYFHFRSDAKNTAVLRAARVDAVSIANNHVLDFDYDALLEMTRILRESGIQYAGAGRNLEEARRQAGLDVAGRKIALIAFTDNEPEWEATADKPGVHFVPIDPRSAQARELFSLVRDTKNKSEIVITSAHWGSNWGEKPEENHTNFAHHLIEAGSDLVFGHSAHIFRGVEFYHGRPILYSCGDFIDDYAVDEVEKNDRSFIFMVEIDLEGRFFVRLYPTVIERRQAQLAVGREKALIIQKMTGLCQDLGTRVHWNEELETLDLSAKA